MWDFLQRKAALHGIFCPWISILLKLSYVELDFHILLHSLQKRYFAEIFKNMQTQAILAPSSFIVDRQCKEVTPKKKKKKKVGGATFDHALRTNQYMKFQIQLFSTCAVTKLLFSHVHQLENSFPIPFSLYSFRLSCRHDSKILFRFVQFSSLFFRLISC